jgi:hypothetical protein
LVALLVTHFDLCVLYHEHYWNVLPVVVSLNAPPRLLKIVGATEWCCDDQAVQCLFVQSFSGEIERSDDRVAIVETIDPFQRIFDIFTVDQASLWSASIEQCSGVIDAV